MTCGSGAGGVADVRERLEGRLDALLRRVLFTIEYAQVFRIVVTGAFARASTKRTLEYSPEYSDEYLLKNSQKYSPA